MLAAILIPAAAFAAPISIRADKTEAANGETVQVSGKAEASSWITLRVTDESQSIVVFDGVKSDAEGGYRFAFVVPSAAAAGKWTVQTGSGTNVATLTLTVKSGVVSPEPTPSGGGSQPTPSPTPSSEASVKDGVISVKPAFSLAQDGRSVASLTIKPEDLQKALAQNADTITVHADTQAAESAVASVPAQALIDLLKNGKPIKLNVVLPFGSYELPLQSLDFEDMASRLQTTADKLEIRIKLAKADSKQSADIAGAIAALGAKQLADAVDFSVEAAYNGQSVPVTQFGGTYVGRTLPLAEGVAPDSATGVFIGSNGELQFVPSVFKQEDGKWKAELKRTGNSLYTVIENRKSFRDTASHWAKADVELLASKLIVQGVTGYAFQPDADITRAQFTAIIVRALGLQEQSGGAPFRDVAAADWFSGSVNAAADAGLVSGYEDGSFRPNAPITREELAVLMNNALRFAGAPGSGKPTEQLLAAFEDSGELAAWSRDAVAGIVEAGITEGKSAGRYEGAAQATRAETAVMVKRLLQKTGFING